MKKCGYIAIIGQPNVGKSTLLNLLVGEKLAGVSRKPQTTRDTVRGILTRPNGQAIFLDTPGMHRPKDLLGDRMIHSIEDSVEQANLLYWMVLPEQQHPGEEKILEMVRRLSIPVFLLINQVDRYPKPHILPVIDHYSKTFSFRELIPISAQEGDNIDLLIQRTFEHLPEGEPVYAEDQLSDQSERFISAEIIREKLFRMMKQELPYACGIMIESFQDRSDGLAEIHATIIVEKQSQKAIIIGRQGLVLKQLGSSARMDLERFLGRKVFLKLWVKVMPKWRKDPAAVKELQ